MGLLQGVEQLVKRGAVSPEVDLPRLPVRVDVSVASICGGGYSIYLELRDEASTPVGLWNADTLPFVQSFLARGKTEWCGSMQVAELDEETLKLVPEVLKQDALLVWGDEDVRVSPEFCKCAEIYNTEYTREQLEAMSSPEVRCVARVKKLGYTGSKREIIDRILSA